MSTRLLPTRLPALAAAFALATAAPAAFADSHADAGDADAAASAAASQTTGDIVDTAIAAGSFKTLVAAVQAAGLVDTLKGPGPFTVFAPTDAAFAALPAGTVENLLKPENRDQLVAILSYHVVPGRVTAAQASTLDSARTVQGGELEIDTANGGVTIDGANVVTADIAASNGLIHVVDKVLLPN